MFALYSNIEYEGRVFHGIFETKALARKAKEYMKVDCEYDTQEYIIEKIPVNTVFSPGDHFDTQTFY